MLVLIRVVSIVLLFAGLAACSTVSGPRARNTTRTFTTVVVDAGHGGSDSGAYRRTGPPEKIVTLDVARRLDRKLRESQLRTVMTRSSDEFISLDRRVAIGKGQANSVFVSVHFNDSSRRRIRGFETYYHAPVAAALAEQIQRKLMTMPGAVNRGVKHANYRVLRNAQYPAVLVECGFLSNRREGGDAGSTAYREQLADKIAEAIVEARYGSGVYNAPPQMAAQAPGSPLAQPARPGEVGQTPPGFFNTP